LCIAKFQKLRCLYDSISSKYACNNASPPPPPPPPIKPPSSGTAVGWIGFTFLLTLLIGVILYIAIGMGVKYRFYEARGLDMVPNLEFWKDFPFLFRDGCVYFVRLITCGKFCSGFSEI